MAIPKLTRDGVLPWGIHRVTPADVRAVFGGGSARRVELRLALEDALEHARQAGVLRMLMNGSFVTGKKEPHDVDIVFQVGEEFAKCLSKGNRHAAWIRERVR